MYIKNHLLFQESGNTGVNPERSCHCNSNIDSVFRNRGLSTKATVLILSRMGRRQNRKSQETCLKQHLFLSNLHGLRFGEVFLVLFTYLCLYSRKYGCCVFFYLFVFDCKCQKFRNGFIQLFIHKSVKKLFLFGKKN